MVSLRDMPAAVIMVFVLVVVLALAAYSVSEIKDAGDFSDNSAAANVTDKGNKGLQTFADFIPVIVIVLVIVLIIGLLVGAFMGGKGMGA